MKIQNMTHKKIKSTSPAEAETPSNDSALENRGQSAASAENTTAPADAENAVNEEAPDGLSSISSDNSTASVNSGDSDGSGDLNNVSDDETSQADSQSAASAENTTAPAGKLTLKQRFLGAFSVTKRSLIFAVILTVLLLAALIHYRSRFSGIESGSLLLGLSFLGVLLIGFLAAIHIKVSNRIAKIINPVIFLLVPVASMCMVECMSGVFIYNFSPQTFFCNYIVYILLYLLVMVFSGSFRMPIIVMTPLIYIFGVVCGIVLTFRGSPVVPLDVLTISTGLAVASSYPYTVSYTLVVGTVIFLLIMMIGIRMTKIKFKHHGSYLCRSVALILILTVTIPFYLTDYAANHGIKPDFWNQARGYRNSGTMLNFVLNTKYLIIEKPADYNASQIPAIVDAFLAENQDDKGIAASAKAIQKRADERAAAEAETEAAQQAALGADSTAAGNMVAGANENGINAANTGDTNANGTDTNVPIIDADTTAGGIAGFTGSASTNNLENQDPYYYLGNGLDENGQPLPNTGLDTDLAVRGTSKENQPASYGKKRKNTAPNVICIMNETFADLRTLGQLSTNTDYMPFVRNLTKNTIKGNLYMPVTGAGTSNSEFEFLTGNSMAFLAAGSNAYELYIKNQTPSLAFTLARQNYARLALHVYYRTSWQRDVNYPLLGFERYDSIETYLDNNLIDSYRSGDTTFFEFEKAVNEQYPDENVLLRRFVSDHFDYKLLTDMYENRDRSKPFFIFNVTMQNHGSYASSYSNFEQKVRLTSTDRYYPQANRFLSLIYESDKAFEELVNYFSKQKEPTIICMFGDHHPNIETGFIESLLGEKIDDLTIEQRQRRFMTPFVIWANYDIDETYIDKMSTNYLSTLLLQTAGLQTTEYNDYLSALYRSLPVIDTNGYITADGEYHTYDETTEYTPLLQDYEKIQYNNMFETIGRHDELFYIPQKDEVAEATD